MIITSSWWPALVGVLQSVCPEATKIIKAQSLNRSNWENLILKSNLVPPYLIVESEEAIQEDWGRDNVTWRQPVLIHYICSTTTTSALVNGGGYDIAHYAESRGINIASNIINYSGSGFQIFNDYPNFTVSEFSPANLVLYRLQAPYFGCTVKARLLWGANNLAGDLWT